MNINIFDTVSITVKSVVKSSNGKYKINDEAYATIKKDCEKLDIMNEEFEFDSFETLLDVDKNTLTIKIITPDITFYHDKSDPFFDIIRHTSRFIFSNESSTDICMALIYGNILEV